LLTFKFSVQEENEIKEFCKLNDIEYHDFVRSCFDKGYRIEKYGLLDNDVENIVEVIKEVVVEKPVEVIKEVIVEKPVEVIKEIEVIKEVIVEKPVETIKEVTVEKPVEVVKEVIIEQPIEVVKEYENKEKQIELQKTIQDLQRQLRDKDERTLQLEKDLVELKKIKGPIVAQYMSSSNLNDNLYK